MRFSAALIVSLGLVCASAAGPYADLDRRLKNAKPSAVDSIVQQSGLDTKDDQLSTLLDSTDKSPGAREKAVKAYVSMRALFEADRTKTTATPIGEIKESGLYRKASGEGGENWLARALQRIRFNFKLPQTPVAPAVGGFSGLGFLVYVMWSILALLVAGFVFFSVRYFRWKVELQKSRMKSTAMLEDDEPERSLDEWLDLASRLESEGRFREAVRCLYVACLLRFDEYRVARFDRTETNWEHLRRIQASPTNPTEFDFRGPTSDFDHIWYGFRPTGAAEVEKFRAAYQALTQLLSLRKVGTR